MATTLRDGSPAEAAPPPERALGRGDESGPRAETRPRRRSETGARMALLGVGFVLGLLMLEVAIRIIEPREVIREYFVRADPVLHHSFIPGAHGHHKTVEFDAVYAINSLGLRNAEISPAKPAGPGRILMLGDSFTEGNGVAQDENFPSLLQARLDADGLARRWQVVNTGVGSYSPLLEYLYLKTQGLDLQPDIVILNFDLSDIYDDIQYTRLARFGAGGDPVAVPAEPEAPSRSRAVRLLVAVKDFFKRHTRTYNFVRRRVSLYVERLKNEQDVSGDIRRDKYAMLREATLARGDRDWTLSYGYLLRIRDALRARGIDFCVTVYPYGLQLSPREWGAGRRFWGFQPGAVYSTEPQELIERFCRRNGIPVVNMCGEFKERSRTEYPLYYEYDGHWRPAGHRIAADVLHRALLPYLQAHEGRTPVSGASGPGGRATD